MTSEWLEMQLKAIECDSWTWPEWKKREVDMPGFGETDLIQELQQNDIEQQSEIAVLKRERDEARLLARPYRDIVRSAFLVDVAGAVEKNPWLTGANGAQLECEGIDEELDKIRLKYNNLVSEIFGGQPLDDMSKIRHEFAVAEVQQLRIDTARYAFAYMANCEIYGPDGAVKWQGFIDRSIANARKGQVNELH